MLFLNVTYIMQSKCSLQIAPFPGSGSGYWCGSANCTFDLNLECPDDLKVFDGDNVVACKSSCLAYDTDEYCCRGEFSDLESCKSSPSAVYFKNNCPVASSYAYDDGTSSFICLNTNYIIRFG
jgi:hypothetical protein